MIRIGPLIGAVQRECADVDRLPGLIDRLLGREQDGGFVLKLDWLRVFGSADGRICNVVQIVFAGEPSGEAELPFSGTSMIEQTGE